MSRRKRQKRDAQRPNIKVLSDTEERKIAQMMKSGLSPRMAEPKAREKIYVWKGKAEM